MSRPPKADLPILAFACQADWDAWLGAEPADSMGVWLKFAKNGSGIASVTKQEAIDTALCHGWIDGQLYTFDKSYFLTRFTPRKAKSIWSGINRKRAIALIDEGRMRPAGHAEIERAKADGRWDAAYASQATAEVPDDLKAALAANQEAGRFFATLTGANRYAVLYRLHNAKKAETRTRKLDEFVAMLARGETIHPKKKG